MTGKDKILPLSQQYTDLEEALRDLDFQHDHGNNMSLSQLLTQGKGPTKKARAEELSEYKRLLEEFKKP